MNWFGELKNKSLEQRTPQWYEYRKKHINASDISSILGISPYKSKYQLWHQYVYDKWDQTENWAMKRGTNAEPRIKALYEEKTGIRIVDKVFESKEYPIFSASLDGWNEENLLVVEFKYPSSKVYAEACAGRVPPHYMAQIQQQLLCSGGRFADFVAYNGSEIVIVRLEKDNALISRIITEGTAFWEAVQRKTPPVTPDELINENEFLEQCLALDAVKAQIAELELKKDNIMTKIEEKMGDKTELDLFDFKISTVTRKGSLDTVKIVKDYAVDEEKYRKPDSTYLKVSRKDHK